MELLAKLYDRNLHPKLTAAQCAGYAGRVRALAKDLQDALDAERVPAANAELVGRVRTSLARMDKPPASSASETYPGRDRSMDKPPASSADRNELQKRTSVEIARSSRL